MSVVARGRSQTRREPSRGNLIWRLEVPRDANLGSNEAAVGHGEDPSKQRQGRAKEVEEAARSRVTVGKQWLRVMRSAPALFRRRQTACRDTTSFCSVVGRSDAVVCEMMQLWVGCVGEISGRAVEQSEWLSLVIG